MHVDQRPALRSRRRFLEQAAAFGALTLGGLAGARSAVAAASELRILFPGGSWQEWFNNTFVKPFEQATRVQTVWKLGLSFEPLAIAQRRRPQWDLIHEDQNTSSQLGALNAVLEWREERIPHRKHVHPALRYPCLAGKLPAPSALAGNPQPHPH